MQIRTVAATSEPRELGEKTYSADDQRSFAELSHDWNPVHTDPVAARRLFSGRQVVHGIHTLLTALDRWIDRTGVAPAAIECRFLSPVGVGDTVIFAQHDDEPGRSRITASVGGLACTEIVIRLGGVSAVETTAMQLREAQEVRHVGAVERPLDEAPGSQVGGAFSIETSGASELAARFPRAAAVFGSRRISAIVALSYFVGMVCPGLHSVFSSVRISLERADGDARLLFFVRQYDARYKRFLVSFRGVIDGELTAFLRPSPQVQPSMREIMARVAPHDFEGARALVLGGSRGLGETVAKLLSAGNADVTITYATGRDDAGRVADEINAEGLGHCATLPLDLRAGSFVDLDIDVASLDTVYYFPTPRIFTKRPDRFDRRLFSEFTEFYIEKFAELCAWLESGAQGRTRKIRVYLPSTVFIDERPRGMTEYAMAKAAAEILAADLNAHLENVTIVSSRLPRMPTDQTASIVPVRTESTIDVLTTVVRELQF
jgi:acyl dehydratase